MIASNTQKTALITGYVFLSKSIELCSNLVACKVTNKYRLVVDAVLEASDKHSLGNSIHRVHERCYLYYYTVY